MKRDPLANLTDEEYAAVEERAATSGLPVHVYIESIEGRVVLLGVMVRRLGTAFEDEARRVVDWLNRKVGGR